MKLVLCHGVFDLLHAGHLEHLRHAKCFGDYLMVSVLADKFAVKRKPIYNEKERSALLAALRCVDQVIVCNAPGPQKIIRQWKPDVYVRGPDYKYKPMPESPLLKKLKIPVRYTKEGPMRTSEAIKRVRNG